MKALRVSATGSTHRSSDPSETYFGTPMSNLLVPMDVVEPWGPPRLGPGIVDFTEHSPLHLMAPNGSLYLVEAKPLGLVVHEFPRASSLADARRALGFDESPPARLLPPLPVPAFVPSPPSVVLADLELIERFLEQVNQHSDFYEAVFDGADEALARVQNVRILWLEQGPEVHLQDVLAGILIDVVFGAVLGAGLGKALYRSVSRISLPARAFSRAAKPISHPVSVHKILSGKEFDRLVRPRYFGSITDDLRDAADRGLTEAGKKMLPAGYQAATNENPVEPATNQVGGVTALQIALNRWRREVSSAIRQHQSSLERLSRIRRETDLYIWWGKLQAAIDASPMQVEFSWSDTQTKRRQLELVRTRVADTVEKFAWSALTFPRTGIVDITGAGILGAPVDIMPTTDRVAYTVAPFTEHHRALKYFSELYDTSPPPVEEGLFFDTIDSEGRKNLVLRMLNYRTQAEEAAKQLARVEIEQMVLDNGRAKGGPPAAAGDEE